MLFDILQTYRDPINYCGIIVINNITKNNIRYTLEFNTIKSNILKLEGMKVKRDNNLIIAEIHDQNKILNKGKSDIIKFSGIGSFPNIKDLKLIINKF